MKKSLSLMLLVFLLAACAPHLFSKTAGTKQEADKSQLYRCENDASFRLKMLNNGQDVWLIYPDHEVNLSRVSTQENRYVSGAITLILNGNDTTLVDGEHIAYQGCRTE